MDNKLLTDLVRGKLKSPKAKAPVRQGKKASAEPDVGSINIIINNTLPIALYLYQVNDEGQMVQIYNDDGTPYMSPGSPPGVDNPLGASVTLDKFYVLKTVFSGSLVQFFYASTGGMTVTVSPVSLMTPNNIGLFPTPTQLQPIPPDSPLMLVGCAILGNSNILVREQYWARGSDSYVLAPGTKRTVTTTIVAGMQQTTSHEESVSKALGFSASVGWGPISSSINGSLNSNSSSLQQMILSSQSTQYESLELHNKTTTGQMYLKWQLVNVVTVLTPLNDGGGSMAVHSGASVTPPSNPSGQGALATIVTAESPVLIDGPYNPLKLPLS